MTYRIHALADGEKLIWSRDGIPVAPDQIWAQTLTIALPKPDDVSYLDLCLVAEDAGDLVAQLRLWLRRTGGIEAADQQLVLGESTLTEATIVGKAEK